MPIYQHNQTDLEFLCIRTIRIGYPVLHGIIKFLTANGVDGSTARKVAFGIHRKVQRNKSLTMEETSLVGAYMIKASGKTTVTSPVNDRRNKLSDNNSPISTKHRDYQEGGLNDYVHQLPARGKIPAVKMDVVTKKSRKCPATIRQLAHYIAST